MWVVRAVIGIAVAGVVAGCTATDGGSQVDLFGPENRVQWQPTRGYEARKSWVWEDGVFRGLNSWVGYPQEFSDFVLECDILFKGKGEGGIAIRSDRTSDRPWDVGYELDIDWHGDRKHGHIHFPVHPQPYRGSALIDVGKWHAVRIRAEGPHVVVFLDGEQVLEFTDDEFASGNICLEGNEGGVKYRNVKVSSLDH